MLVSASSGPAVCPAGNNQDIEGLFQSTGDCADGCEGRLPVQGDAGGACDGMLDKIP
jgi:hypothetical protein